MKVFLSLAVSLTFLTAFAHGQYRQPNRRVKPSPAPASEGVSNSSAPIDIEAARLPIGYKGNDPQQIFKTLADRRTPKGEFETTDAYRDRIAKELARPVLGSLTAFNSIFAFELGGRLRLISEYNADTENLQVGVRRGQVTKGITLLSDDWVTLPLPIVVSTSQEKYQATNAYGAQVVVDKSTLAAYELIVRNWKDWEAVRYTPISGHAREPSSARESSLKPDSLLFSTTMSPAEARLVKPHLKLLGLVRLKYPFTEFDVSRSKPTFDVPEDTIIRYNYLHADLIELWLFDANTGKVLQKRRR